MSTGRTTCMHLTSLYCLAVVGGPKCRPTTETLDEEGASAEADVGEWAGFVALDSLFELEHEVWVLSA